MTLTTTILPVDEQVATNIRLWLARPEFDKLIECVEAEGKVVMAEMANEIIEQDECPNESLKGSIEAKKLTVRKQRDFIAMLRHYHDHATPFISSTIQ